MKWQKIWLVAALLVLVLILAWIFSDDDLEKGVKAYRSGDYATALANLTPLAEEGHIEAEFYLGVMYDNGWGVPQDDVEAVKWYRRVAKLGYFWEAKYAESQFNLGMMYEKGRGVPQNNVRAYVWYYFAAENGVEKAIKNRDIVAGRISPSQMTEAQYNLGLGYKSGTGVEGDDAKAMKWLRRAAEADFAPAQYHLGGMYEELGFGLPDEEALRNVREAVRLVRLAAEAGYADAQYELGKMYNEGGRGVPRYCVEAAKWFILAAEQGYIHAQNTLAKMYDEGGCVREDWYLAYMWYDIVANQEHEPAEITASYSFFNIKSPTETIIFSAQSSIYGMETFSEIFPSSESPESVAKVREMSRQCRAQKYKNCDQLSPQN